MYPIPSSTVESTPSPPLPLPQVLFQTAGYILSDVMADALMVERSKLEPSLRVGTMQATCYTLRYMGNILGSTCGTLRETESKGGGGALHRWLDMARKLGPPWFNLYLHLASYFFRGLPVGYRLCFPFHSEPLILSLSALLTGTLLYNKEEWGWGLSIGQIFTLNALVPVLLVFPFLYHLSDPFEWDQVR